MSLPSARPGMHGPCPVREPGALAQRWRFEATGTCWQVLSAAPLPPALRDRIVSLVDAFEGVWSRFRHDSVVRRAAESGPDVGPLTLDLPPGSSVLLDLYDRLHRATDGRIDPTAPSSASERSADAPPGRRRLGTTATGCG